ncbi:hypothetical protein LEP1GSC047_3803 [Leptospira inadai serovar Lyme str. 10]|uniref:Uncharacterized protein n=1 Tax=Leptospira inadai serovar Lyme str. 10 TaxID=1049790 RepID=V6HX41_9LEPT|nr:hypothetical protein LEP1GSC047_3803 [Leptospira inadai serovar Lyme str. 10]
MLSAGRSSFLYFPLSSQTFLEKLCTGTLKASSKPTFFNKRQE